MFKKIEPKRNVTRSIEMFPHCDQRVLHAPGECFYCDKHPEWQALRFAWGIAFTGYEPEGKELPCPATHARGAKAQVWGGNVPVFIIEILKQGWQRSRQFPNYYTEGEADGILRRNPSLTISGDFLDYRKREIKYDVAPVKPCPLPSFGWRCTRGFHEDGPCAAVPTNPSWLGKNEAAVSGARDREQFSELFGQ